ncbi:MAG: hypothetical protein ACREQ5_17530, partial [Candidatus Dormibacteria bacterium]
MSYLGQFILGRRDIRRWPPEPVDRGGADLLGDDPSASVCYLDAVGPADPFDAGEGQDGDQSPHG